jgi:hypothetical protein
MLPDKYTIKIYHLYSYTFLDDLSYIKSPFEHFQDAERCKIEDAIRLIGDRFREFGWEGDGELGIIWLPPFVDVGIEDTYGTFIWHVKQMNNGISFIASDIPLNFRRFADQNQELTAVDTAQAKLFNTFIESEVTCFTDSIVSLQGELQNSLSFLNISPSPIARMIIASQLFHYQNALVGLFNEFMDECYLKILIEAIDSGNPYKITLRKTRAEVDAASYIPEPEDPEEAADISDASTWFTIKGLISDLWKAYKWEPFKKKSEMLFKSLNFTPDEKYFFQIKKHVVIRNCMQHHEARLDRDSLKILGRDKLEILDGAGTQTIEAWKPIVMTIDELNAFITHLLRFTQDFHDHVEKRIPARINITKKPITP